MSDAGLSDEYQSASPWPLFVALGLAISEVGVVLGIRPVAVGGLLLFVGAIAGILRESGYVRHLERVFVTLGGLLLLASGVIFTSVSGPSVRGESILTAGVLCVLAGLCWFGYVQINDHDTVPT